MPGPPPPTDCEPARWQSKQKHAFIEAYLRIWPEKVNPKTAPSLTVIDLNAGWGWCHDAEANKPPWEATAVLSAKCLRDYQTTRGRMLILNSFNPEGGSKQARQLRAVTEAVEAFRATNPFRLETMALPIEAAVQAAKKLVKREFPNVWLLDPYKPAELPWGVVESIISQQHEWKDDKGRTRTRRPEVFISLMTHDLQRNAEAHPESMTICLGQPEDLWRPAFEELIAQGLNKRDAALELYLRRLREHYEKEPFTLEIASTHGNIVYVLIFCTDQDAGHYMMKREGLPAYRVWRERKWQPSASEISATRRETRKADNAGHKLGRLDDFK